MSNYVENCSKVLDHNKDAAIAYTDYAFFGSRAKSKYENFTEEWKGEIILDTFYQINFPEFTTREELIAQVEKRNCIHGSSMFRRSIFDKVGGYKKSNNAEDHNLFKRMLLHADWTAKKANNTNLEYRQHSIHQANNIVVMQMKMMYYKKMYEEVNKYNNSRYFKVANKIYRGLRFLKQHYKNPLKILKAVKKKLLK